MANEGNVLTKFYARVEESFYNVMDSVETRGIPVYNYVELLEKRGIPAFPFTVGLISLIILLLLFVFVFTPTGVSVTPTFKTDTGDVLNGVYLTITQEDGKQVFSGITDNQTEIVLPASVRAGSLLALSASKENYSSGSATIDPVLAGPNQKVIILSEQVDFITGELVLTDQETGTAIRDASVTAVFEGTVTPISAINQQNGTFTLSSIPKGKPISLTIKPKNYEAPTQIEHTFLIDGEKYLLELIPKAEFSEGKSVLTITVKDEQSQLVSAVTIQLYNAQTNARITNEIADEGVLHQELPVGTPVRVVVSKSGFLTYDSSDSNESKTLREAEESFDVLLQKGGATQNVIVKDAVGNLLTDATVTLWNQDGEVVDQNATDFTGSVTFKGLQPDQNYTVGAYRENYLPKSQSTTNPNMTITLVLESADPNNSSFVTIRVQDEFGASVTNAKVDLFKQLGTIITPIGIPQLETDITGILQVRLALGTPLLVHAMQEGLEGFGQLTVGPGTNNVVNVVLLRDPTVKTLRFTDLAGTELPDGHVTVTCNDGTILFDGNIENARVTFDAEDCVDGIVHIESASHVQDTPINFQGAGLKNIVFEGKDVSDLAPLVEFKGIQNENGETILGLAADSDAFAVFTITWPTGQFNGGLHVRVGDDAIKTAVSQSVFINGFSGSENGLLFSKTFNPPSNEAVDVQNMALPGEPAKWVNAYFTNPIGQTTVKVRLHGSSSLARDQVNVSYRAWVESAGRFYRNPSDEKLNLAAGNAALQGLYAKVTTVNVPTFDQTTQVCKQSTCLYLSLQDESGQAIDFTDFEAAINKVYVLQAVVVSSSATNGTLTAEILSPPNAALDAWNQNSSGIVNTSPDFAQTSATIPIVGIGVAGSQTYSVRLRGTKVGFAKLRITAKVGEQSVVESRAFRVFAEKMMKVNISPNPGRVGEKVQLNVKADTNAAEPVEKALIVITDAQGNEAYRLVGDGTPLKGKGGRYVIPAVLKAGSYRIAVEQREYARVELPYDIALSDAVVFESDAYVRIPSGTKSGFTSVNVINQTGLNWSDVTFAIKGLENQRDFQAVASGLSVLSAGQAGELRVTGTYNGKEERARATGTIEAIGTLEDGSIAVAKTPLVLDFNPKLDPNCLEVSPTPLKATLFSDAGAEAQVVLTVRNHCTQKPEESIVLRSTVEGQLPPTEMTISVPEISILSNEEKTVQVAITNKVDRSAIEKQDFTFTITLTDAGVTKTIPLTVTVFSKRLALSVPNNVTIYVAQTVRGQAEKAVAPIVLRNLSNVPLQNLTFSLRSGEIEGVSLLMQPSTGLARLNPNQSFPAFIQVTSDVEKSKVVKDELIIRGGVDGKAYDLAKVNIIVNASAPSCLKVNTTRLSFEAEQSELGTGVETAVVVVQNNCGQEVRIIDINPKNFGANYLTFGPVDNFVNIIPIGGTSQYKIVLSKQQSLKTSGSFYMIGQLLSPQLGAGGFKYVTSDPVPIFINLGTISGEDSLAENEIELPVCDDGSGTRKKMVKFPKISSGANDCSSAYCDASQAAVFLVEKIQKMYQIAESKMLEKNRTTLGTDCANKAACDLSAFGVETEKFNLYMQNDRVTPELIRATIEKNEKFASLRGFDPILGGIAGFGFGRSIVLPPIEGCGKYPLELSGAVETVGVTAQQGRETFTVRFKEGKGKTTTVECQAKIQNVANFLPKDDPATGGVRSYATRQGTWLAMVDSPREMQKEGIAIAHTVLGSKDRYANNVSNVNHIFIKTSTQVSRLVQVQIDRQTASGPVEIEALINEDLFKNNKEEATREVGKILADLRNKNPAAGSCISEDESYLSLVAGDSKLGGLPQVSECRMNFSTSALINSTTAPSTKTVSQYTKNKPYVDKPTGNKYYEENGQYYGIVDGETKAVSIKQEAFNRIVEGASSPATANALLGTQSEKADELLTARAPADELRLTANTEQCCSFTVSGFSRNQQILPTLGDGSYDDFEAKKMTGISSTVFKVKEGDAFKPINEKSSVGYALERKTDVVDGKKQEVFTRDFQFCAVGNAAELGLMAQGGGVETFIIAKDLDRSSGSTDELESEPKRVLVNACGIHPYRLVERLSNETKSFNATPIQKEKVFVATLAWKGDAGSHIALKDLVVSLAENEIDQGTLGGLNLRGSGLSGTETKSGKIDRKSAEFTPVLGYLAGCVGARVVGDLALGFFTGGAKIATMVPNLIFDCGIPAGLAITKTFAGTDNDVILKSVGQAMEPIGETIADFFGFDSVENNEEANEILGTGVTTTSAKAIVRGIFKSEGFKETVTDWVNKLKTRSATFTHASDNYPKLSKHVDTITNKKTAITTIEGEISTLRTQRIAMATGPLPPGARIDQRQLAVQTLAEEITSKEKEIEAAKKAIEESKGELGKAIDALKSENTKILEDLKALNKADATAQTVFTSNEIAIKTIENATKQAEGNPTLAKQFLAEVDGKPKALIDLLEVTPGVAGAAPAVNRIPVNFDAAKAFRPSAGTGRVVSAGIFSPKGIKIMKTITSVGADIGVGVVANLVGYHVYNTVYNQQEIQRQVEITTSMPGGLVDLKNFSTYQITIDKTNPRMPKWTFELVNQQNEVPQNAVVLPEVCDSQAFETGLDDATVSINGSQTPPATAVTP